jgi:hypothetical protein
MRQSVYLPVLRSKMVEQKWTPGPWKADMGLVTGMESRNRFKGTPSLDIFDANEWPVELSDEAVANAHLIASAPDLYEALNEILNYSGGADHATDDPYVMDRARAAFSKAQGEIA